jgi:hypothetical protein
MAEAEQVPFGPNAAIGIPTMLAVNANIVT